MSFLDNLRKKPYEKRKRIFIFLVSFFALLVLVLWGFTIQRNLSQTEEKQSFFSRARGFFSTLRGGKGSVDQKFDQAVEDYKRNNR